MRNFRNCRMKRGIETGDLSGFRQFAVRRLYTREIVRIMQRGQVENFSIEAITSTVDNHRTCKFLTTVHDAVPDRADFGNIFYHTDIFADEGI